MRKATREKKVAHTDTALPFEPREILFEAVAHRYSDARTGQEIPSVNKIITAVYGSGLECAPTYFVDRAADLGHERHAELEEYVKNKVAGQSEGFINLYKACCRKGWSLTNGWESERILCAETPAGPFCGTRDLYCGHLAILADLKTSKTWTKKQAEKAQMQLSFYAYADRQAGRPVEKAYIIRANDSIGEILEVELLPDSFVEETVRKYYAGEKVEPAGKKTATAADLAELKQNTELLALKECLLAIEQAESKAKEIRERLLAEMESRGIEQLDIEGLKISYVAATERKSVDTAKLKAERPEVYENYLKVSKVKPSLRVTLAKEKKLN